MLSICYPPLTYLLQCKVISIHLSKENYEFDNNTICLSACRHCCSESSCRRHSTNSPENSFSAPAAEIGQEPETETKTIDAETDETTSVPLNDEKVNVVGVEWEGESPKPEIRYKENGKWSSWQSLEAEDGGPDAGTPDAQNATEATSAVVPIVNSEEVQVRSADKAADTESLEITTASTEVTEEDKTIASGTPGVTNTASITGQVGAFAAQTTDLNAGNVPTAEALAWNPELKANVVTRKEWGANEKQVKCQSSVASSNKGVIVHHTAGSNSYSRSQAPGIIRGYLTFHTQSKGWCDLGYNFLVDKYGTIYEGRAGSMDKAVVGAHASGFNTGTLGISVMGTYGSSAPPAAAQNSVARIAAWGANKWGYNPTGTMKMTSGGGELPNTLKEEPSLSMSLVDTGTPVQLPALVMHSTTD